ncbi:MAG: hypothetical protein U0359_34975 [Byssovorax sp.]
MAPDFDSSTAGRTFSLSMTQFASCHARRRGLSEPYARLTVLGLRVERRQNACSLSAKVTARHIAGDAARDHHRRHGPSAEAGPGRTR